MCGVNTIGQFNLCAAINYLSHMWRRCSPIQPRVVDPIIFCCCILSNGGIGRFSSKINVALFSHLCDSQQNRHRQVEALSGMRSLHFIIIHDWRAIFAGRLFYARYALKMPATKHHTHVLLTRWVRISAIHSFLNCFPKSIYYPCRL